MITLLLVLAFGCGKEKKENSNSQTPEEITKPIPAVPDNEQEGNPDEISDVAEPSLETQPQDQTENETSAGSETPEENDTNDEEPGSVTDEGIADVPEEDTSNDDELTADNFRVISLKDLKAYPSEMIIKVGTTVEWRNVNDNFQHIIGWKDQKSMGVTPEPILMGQSWSYTFNEPGVIKWFSTARPTIQGVITVEPADDKTS